MVKFETKTIAEAKKTLMSIISFVGSSVIITPFEYDAFNAKIVCLNKNIEPPIIRPLEIALLTIQQNGSAKPDYESISKAPVRKVAMYVGAGIDEYNRSCIIVSQLTNERGELIEPAELRLEDLVGYETLKKF